MVWVVGDATINGSETGTSFKQALFFMECGFNLHDTMIYEKRNPIPLTHNRYEQCFEYMFVFSKGKPKTFNPLMVKTSSAGAYNGRRNTAKSKDAATRNRDEVSRVKEEKQATNIFKYVCGRQAGTGDHPAPFPEQLAKDHIITWSNKKDLVYDCFTGAGTTLKMAISIDRNYIGSEISEEYCKIIKTRIKNAEPELF